MADGKLVIALSNRDPCDVMKEAGKNPCDVGLDFVLFQLALVSLGDELFKDHCDMDDTVCNHV